MGRLRTLGRDMTAGQLLVFRCQGCGATYHATQKQAVKRFGAGADPMWVRHLARCKACGSAEVDVRMEQGGAAYGVIDNIWITQQQRELLTMSECRRRGWRVFGCCNRCDNEYWPGSLEAMIARGTGDKPIALLVGNRRLQCRACDGSGRIGRVLVLDGKGEPMAEYMALGPNGERQAQTPKDVIRRLSAGPTAAPAPPAAGSTP